MKKIITIVTILIVISSFSQTAIKKSSIDSGGASATNGTISMVYTIGEVAVQETTNGTTHISEGFIGTDMMSSLGLNDYTPLSGVQLYPNPAINFVTVSFSETSNYTITLYDLLGKEIATYQTQNSDTKQISLKQLPKAVYMLLITNDNTKQFTSYKIIKK